MVFMPKRVFVEEEALNYPLGKELYQKLRLQADELKIIKSHHRVTGIPGKTPYESYREAKNTLVIGVRKSKAFATCKPSAHYQLPLATSCPGKCEYCYLQTTLGPKPYLRIYVNIDEILDITRTYISKRLPEVTVFEGAATSDPLAVEHLGGSLSRAIQFFAGEEKGRFRFVTKFTDVEPLLALEHNGHTRFRFSINSNSIIGKFEHGTPPLEERITAARKVVEARYPLGFIIAPIILYEGWENDYRAMFALLAEHLGHRLKHHKPVDLTFELITHRFTKRAKNRILERFPQSGLPMSEDERRVKYGQFGYIKYVYREEEYARLKNFFKEEIARNFPEAGIEYFV